MKKWLCIAFCLGSVVSARPLSEIKKTKEIRLCFSNSPGIVETEDKSCKEDCAWKGPSFEVVKTFAESLGKDIKIKTYNVEWDEQFMDHEKKVRRGESYIPELFKKGQCDIYPSNLTKNDWRNQLMNFAIVFPSKMMVLVRSAEKKNYKDIKTLFGKKAVVKSETSFHSWLDEQNISGLFKEKPVSFEITTDGSEYDILLEGKGDFALIDTDAGLYLTRTTHKKLHPAFLMGDVDQIGWGFSKPDQDLLKAANDFLDQQRKNTNSQVNQIWKKYYGKTLAEFTQFVMSVK